MAPNMQRPKRSQEGMNSAAAKSNTSLELLKYTVIPTVIITVFPFLGVFLAVYAQDGALSRFTLAHFLGNQFTWTLIVALTAWAVAFQRFSSKMYHGPTTNFGYTPKYAANGFTYYWTTISVFLTLNFLSPSLSTKIVRDFPLLVGNLVSFAFVLCFYLWYKGKRHPSSSGDKIHVIRPAVFEFYRGMELHPRIVEVDVKQLVVCRISLILWQILIIAFLLAGYQRNGGPNAGHMVNVLLQTIYLAKFYWWETGYFNTLDITLDRAGFYICWGCLGFLPIGYTYASYYFIYHPPQVSPTTALLLFVLSAVAIFFNYEVDRQKEHFRDTNGKCKIFGRDAAFMEVQYKSANGTVKTSKLLLSGFWGIARHLNYSFELIAALIWNLPGWGLGPLPFLYNIFLFILLTHRVFRDEIKCKGKYGAAAWNKYCRVVPYRLIPYVF